MTTGRIHSGCPVNLSQVPTSDYFLIPQGSLKRQGKLGGVLGLLEVISSRRQSKDLLASQDVGCSLYMHTYTTVNVMLQQREHSVPQLSTKLN